MKKYTKLLLLTFFSFITIGCSDTKESTNHKEEGLAFLEKNKKLPNVKETESGLQYKVIHEGHGKQPNKGSSVTVHYAGRLINGEEFDSSIKRGQPSTFRVSQVITGWTEGLQLMKEGSKYEFYIPYYLAYGQRQKGSIPPYATLIFEVQLLEVN